VLKGFKDFIMKGNVLDLAVAVVVGAAFTAIVTAFTTSVVKPLIAAIGGNRNVSGLAWTIVAGNKDTTVDLGAVITAVINFLLVAAVVYFILIVPYEHLKSRMTKDAEKLEEADILVEIRDLLAAQTQAMAGERLPSTGQFPAQPK
jgi:large conductance mechanosensitive channel